MNFQDFGLDPLLLDGINAMGYTTATPVQEKVIPMIMTNQPSIQDVLFFPQMRPEKKAPVSTDEDFVKLGIPAEWVPVLQKAGYKSPADLKNANPNKLINDLSGLRKKMKLEIPALKIEDVKSWTSA